MREKILTELHDQHQVPQWDFPKVAQELGGNEYEDITEVPTIGEWKRARDPASEWQPTVRLNKKSGAPIPEVPAKGSDDLIQRQVVHFQRFKDQGSDDLGAAAVATTTQSL